MEGMGITEEYYTWWWRYIHTEKERDGRE